MIRLYTSRDKCAGVKWIRNIDPYFNSFVHTSKLTKGDLNLLRKLEGVELLDSHFGTFLSPEGAFTASGLSSGMKTLLIIRFLKRENKRGVGVDITECGPKMLDYVFEEVTDGSIPVLLQHTDVLRLRNRVISVNDGPVIRSMDKLFDELMKLELE